MLQISAFLSEVASITDAKRVAAGDWDVHEGEPDTYAVVSLDAGERFTVFLHIDDAEKGRRLAESILAACFRMDSERARWERDHPEKAVVDLQLAAPPEVLDPVSLAAAQEQW